jgi:hypothetical protein
MGCDLNPPLDTAILGSFRRTDVGLLVERVFAARIGLQNRARLFEKGFRNENAHPADGRLNE